MNELRAQRSKLTRPRSQGHSQGQNNQEPGPLARSLHSSSGWPQRQAKCPWCTQQLLNSCFLKDRHCIQTTLTDEGTGTRRAMIQGPAGHRATVQLRHADPGHQAGKHQLTEPPRHPRRLRAINSSTSEHLCVPSSPLRAALIEHPKNSMRWHLCNSHGERVVSEVWNHSKQPLHGGSPSTDRTARNRT